MSERGAIISYTLEETSHKLMNETPARIGKMVWIKGVGCEKIDGWVKSDWIRFRQWLGHDRVRNQIKLSFEETEKKRRPKRD